MFYPLRERSRWSLRRKESLGIFFQCLYIIQVETWQFRRTNCHFLTMEEPHSINELGSVYHSHLSAACNSQHALGQTWQSKQGSTTSWTSWAELRRGGPLQPSSWPDWWSLSFLRNHTKDCISHFYIIVIKHCRGTTQRRTDFFWLIFQRTSSPLWREGTEDGGESV